MSDENLSNAATAGKWVTNWLNKENVKKERYKGTPRLRESDRLAALAKKREQEFERNRRQRENLELAKAARMLRAKEAADRAPSLRDRPLDYVRYWKERLATCQPFEKRTAYLRLHEAEVMLKQRLEAL